MSNIFRHSLSFGLAISLLISSVGYSVISFACPEMEDETTICTNCASSDQQAQKNCCKPRVERKVVKAEFEKPEHLKPLFVQIACIAFTSIAINTVDIARSSVTRFETCLYDPPADTCALLSTYLI